MLGQVVAICESAPGARRDRAREELGAIFLRLIADAEHDIRRRLAERLSAADWAPRALIRSLALDDIDIARPVIAASPVLEDPDLLEVLARATLEHQVAVADRPGLSPAVVDAVIAAGEPAAMSALAANGRVVLHADAMERLVAAARRVAALRAPLARRPELSEELARGLYAWVGATLRQTLVDRFRLDPAQLDAALSETVRESHANRPARPEFTLAEADGAEMEARLVAKLEAAGQLKPGYLLRVLREGRLSLFEAGLAALAGVERPQVRAALDAPSPAPLALACSAVGLDRSAFPTVVALVRSLNGDRPGEVSAAFAEVSDAFSKDMGDAVAAFHAWASRAGTEAGA